MRVVLDTNVLLSALFTRGVCEALLDACLDSDACTIVLCQHILDEFARHAGGKFGAPPADVQSAMEFLRKHAEIVEPALVPAGTCPDPDDLPVLGAAMASRADLLVTGDTGLLGLHVAMGIPILSPRDFYDRLR